MKGWGGFFYWLLSGLLYGAAGVIAFIDPALAAVALTLVLAIALITSGILRIWMGIRRLRPAPGWGWVVASGVVSVLARISHQKRGWGAFEGGFCFGRWVAARCTGAGEVGFRTMAARRCCVRA
jgi:hypothetical protein